MFDNNSTFNAPFLQIEFNRQCEDAWARLIPVIEGVVVEDPTYVRSRVQEQNASDSLTPPLNYTIGRAGRNNNPPVASAPSGFGGGYAPPQANESSNSSGFGSSAGSSSPHESYPAPPSCPPPAPPVSAANPFGESNGGGQGARKQSYAFTDEEGEGGDDGEVEEV